MKTFVASLEDAKNWAQWAQGALFLVAFPLPPEQIPTPIDQISDDLTYDGPAQYFVDDGELRLVLAFGSCAVPPPYEQGETLGVLESINIDPNDLGHPEEVWRDLSIYKADWPADAEPPHWGWLPAETMWPCCIRTRIELLSKGWVQTWGGVWHWMYDARKL